MRLNLLIWIFVFILFSQIVLGLGISPAEKVVDYVPGKSVSLTYYIVNNEHKEMDVAVSVSGQLGSYAMLDKATVHIISSEEMKPVKVNLDIPSGLQPGDNSLKISVSEVVNPSSGGVAALLKVTSKIIIRVPYPPGYNASNATNTTAVAAGGAAGAEAVPPQPVQEIKDYGSVDILGFQRYFIKGRVNEFTIDIENSKDVRFDRVYAVISIEGIGTIQSPYYSLEPKQSTTIVSYWDARDIAVGDYNAMVILYYGNYTAAKQGKVHVVTEEKYVELTGSLPEQIPIGTRMAANLKEYTPYLLLAFGLLLIIFINLVWFLFIKDKGNRGIENTAGKSADNSEQCSNQHSNQHQE